jgi:hypothetical protein
MRNNIVPPEGHAAPAVYRLTREFLAEIAPGFDPDSDERRRYELLADERRVYTWLESHPDRDLVAQFHREVDADFDEWFFDLMGLHTDEVPPGRRP